MAVIGSSLSAQEIKSTGLASCYPSVCEGKPTASGELYVPEELTASHEFLPFGTLVKVTNLRTGQSVIVKINDRFPYRTNRLIDLSSSAAKEINLFGNVAPMVAIEVIEWPKEESIAPAPVEKAG